MVVRLVEDVSGGGNAAVVLLAQERQSHGTRRTVNVGRGSRRVCFYLPTSLPPSPAPIFIPSTSLRIYPRELYARVHTYILHVHTTRFITVAVIYGDTPPQIVQRSRTR